MLTAFARAFRTPDLRKKLLFTLSIVVVYRLGAHVPVPGIDYTVVNAFKTAGKPLVPIVGADNNQFLKQMLTQYAKLKGAAVTNPATVGGAAMSVALKLLSGQSAPKTQLLTPQVWSMPGSKAIMKKFYSPKLPPTYSDTLQLPGYTTYSIGQLNAACK